VPSPLLRTTWPVFAAELAAALAEDGEEQLAEQVGRLRVVGVCRCTDDFCQSFHTAPEAPGGHGEGHRNVWVRAPWPGYLVLDVVADDIVYVEVLYRSPLD
jgi:hypothetical protein